MGDSQHTTNNNEEGSDYTKPVCTFIKAPRKGNIRKRKTEGFSTDDTTEEVEITKKERIISGLAQSTKDLKKTHEKFTWESNRTAVPSGSDQKATASNLDSDIGDKKTLSLIAKTQTEMKIRTESW